ncbi:Haloacid dehydrogenase [Pandoravirus salinus]|uniref:Haloacid dehydrogenase n=1 Tax=Pandoravirus salinus TaxID=1349410 RepID=S4VTK0_9VIRU|nr:Haloacid dehydrogenase [Pandoravirus salinus]AGO83643.1 Haloacid dehydrogenase [Pandoravirus salinus]
MYAVHASPAGRMAAPARHRRASFGPIPVGAGGQTTERDLAMLGARRRRDSLGSLASPSWSSLGRPQPAPGSPAWTAGLVPAAPGSPLWGLATPTPHVASAALPQQQHDPAAFKAAVDAYMTSPTYDRFVESLCAEAMRAVDDRMRGLGEARATGARVRRGSRDLHEAGPVAVPRAPVPLAIFDVDDTLLSSHPGRRHRFAAHLLSAGTRMPSAYLPPLDPVVRLYRSLRARGIRTAILTGRRSTNEAVTLDNLRWAGVDGWDHAIFRAVGTPEQHIDAVDYKSRQRARLAAAGYEIVANVGDQHSDLHGGNSGVAVKLPNPMHTIP